MQRDLAAIYDMLLHGSRVIAMRREHSLDDLRADDDLVSALLYHVIILGEAARRVSEQGRAQWPLPWPKIVGLRNVIVHDYDEVDLDLVWQIAQNDLPPLMEQLQAILAAAEPR